MTRSTWFSRLLSMPAMLLAGVWCAMLIGVVAGPIDYARQPSLPVLLIVAVGLALFAVASRAGTLVFRMASTRDLPGRARLNSIVAVTGLAGIVGIAMIAIDRTFLSGINLNVPYAELLRCMPQLADVVEIKRTPLLYAGYSIFSFGFASLILFILKGEEISGSAALLAQLSIVSPIGYALLYAGRMPILLIIVLILAAMMVRLRQGRRALPAGHHLLLKIVILVLLFGVYTNAVWSSRHSLCSQISGAFSRPKQDAGPAPAQKAEEPQEKISSAKVSQIVTQATKSPNASASPAPADYSSVLGTLKEWHVQPRGYVSSAIQAGSISPNAAMSVLSTYFYLTHGVRVVDETWRARTSFSPHWGIYEIGVLSPIFRIFLPKNDQLPSLEAQLKAAGIYGYFPTVWAAVFIDFGLTGAVLYVLLWGVAAGWSACGTGESNRVTPGLLLTFILASILLSPIQSPLGVANSALVIVSMLVAGLAVDYTRRETTSRERGQQMMPSSAT